MEFYNTTELMWIYNRDINQSILWNSIILSDEMLPKPTEKTGGAVSERSEEARRVSRGASV